MAGRALQLVGGAPRSLTKEDRMKLAIRFAAVGLSVAGLVSAAASNTAVAVLRPTQGNTVEGKATFTTTDTGTRVRVHLTGLTPGKHAFHIHEKGDCSAPDGASAGGHFNPSGEPHAAPTDAHRHTGDLGNLEANKDGVADLDYTDPRASLDGRQLDPGPRRHRAQRARRLRDPAHRQRGRAGGLRRGRGGEELLGPSRHASRRARGQRSQ